MADTGATLEPGDDLSRMNRFVGNKPPGDGPPEGSGGRDPKDGALEQIGAVMTARATKRFREQRFGPAGWPARAVPNIAGIITDLEAGKSPPSRRWEPRPALSDTGRLRGSITWRRAPMDSVEIGSNLEYAGKAQYGGTSSFPITRRVKDGLARLIAQGKDVQGKLAALMDEDEYTVTTPERIFVGVDDDDEKDIERIIDRWFHGRPYTIDVT